MLVRIISASLLGLVCSASVSSAECAWVLWTRTWTWTPRVLFTPTFTQTYEVRSAHGTRAECEAIVSLYGPDERAATGHDAATGVSRSIRSLCLPDTIDPREPKGK